MYILVFFYICGVLFFLELCVVCAWLLYFYFIFWGYYCVVVIFIAFFLCEAGRASSF